MSERVRVRVVEGFGRVVHRGRICRPGETLMMDVERVARFVAVGAVELEPTWREKWSAWRKAR
jgi:hypothetical protein